MLRRVIAVCALIALCSPNAGFAFTGDFLISDRDFTDASAMSLGDVQQFLQERQSPLSYRFLPDSSEQLKMPAEIIWFAAQEAHINPRALLATLQKEQRLITTANPSARQVDFAMGYGCPDGSGCSDRFRGFGKQIRGAALQFRGYLDDLATKGETIARWSVGRMKATGDGFDIAPKNAATAALYSYTPWRGGAVGSSRVGGNFSFVRIFRQWFLGGAWPDGTVLEAPDGSRWLLSGGTRRRFATPAVFAARTPTSSVITVNAGELETYEAGTPLRFAEYAVLEGPDGTRWLLIGDTRRKIASRHIFRTLGFNPEEIERASADDLAAYREGSTITTATDHPRGTFVREKETKKLFAIVGKEKLPLLDPALAAFHFDGIAPVVKTAKELARVKTGKPLTFPDGVLITAPKALPTVFFISRGERRPFVNPRALELLGYQWSDVRHVANVALDVHPLGSPIEDLSGDTNGTATVARSTPIVAPTMMPIVKPYVSGLSVF